MAIKITNDGGTLYFDAIGWDERQSDDIPISKIATRLLGAKVNSDIHSLSPRTLDITCRFSDYEKQILDKIFSDSSKVTITTGEGLEYVENGNFDYNRRLYDEDASTFGDDIGIDAWEQTGAGSNWYRKNPYGEAPFTLVAFANAESAKLYQMFNDSYVKQWLIKLNITIESFSYSSTWTYTGWLNKPIIIWDYTVYHGRAIPVSNITALSYNHQNSYFSGCGGTTYGIVKTEILYSDDTTTEVETHFTNDNWYIVDLSGYLSAGKYVIGLRFQVLEYGNGDASIDDVSLVAT